MHLSLFPVLKLNQCHFIYFDLPYVSVGHVHHGLLITWDKANQYFTMNHIQCMAAPIYQS